MTDHDDDLRALLRSAADRAKLRDGAEQRLLRAARLRRRLVAAVSALGLVLVVGGIAGASILWTGDRQVSGPAVVDESEAPCGERHYDVAVLIAMERTQAEVDDLSLRLLGDERVRSIQFISREEAEKQFREKYPDHDGPLPTGAREDQIRIALEPGVEPSEALMSELAELGGDGAVGPAPEDCATENPTVGFARYFFEAGSRDASASGVLEVNAQEGTLCYEATVENVTASHLLRNTGVTGGGRRFERMIAATFFEPGVGPTPSAAGNVSTCLRGEELGELEHELHVLIDHPEDFRVDLHRGADDDPGLVAGLETEPPVDSDLPGCEQSLRPPTTATKRGRPLEVVSKDGEEVIEVVFPDGSTADLVPGGLMNPGLTMPFDKLVARPYPAGGPVGRMSRPNIFYGGIPAEYEANELVGCVRGPAGEAVPIWDSKQGDAIVLRFGPWHVFIDGPRGALEVWAEELRGEVVRGWLVLQGGKNLLIGPENDPGDAPLMLDGSDRNTMRLIELWPRDCSDVPGPDEAKVTGTVGTHYTQFCLDDANIEVHVASDVPEFTESVRNELQIRNVRLVHPLEAYTIQP